MDDAVKIKRHVYRIGHMVEIVKPEIFVRCGYPLDRETVIKNMTGDERARINELIISFGIEWTDHGGTYQRVRREIEEAIAYGVLRTQGFGGFSRSIHTRTEPEYANRRCTVVGKRVVKTGGYSPASGGSYEYPDDYDPAMLVQQQAHIILEVHRSDEDVFFDTFEIEAANVKPVKANEK